MSIKNHGLLVAVTITKPQLTAKDDKATGDAEAINNARGAGQYRKDLYPKHLIAPIQEVESQVRAYVRSQTLPWGPSTRVLPAAKFMEFQSRLNQFEVAFGQAVTVFMQNYTNVLAAAQQQQGALFDPSLYPDTSALRAEFSFAVRFMPVTDTNDFRVALQQEELDLLTKQVQAQAARDHDATAQDAVARLKTVVAHLAGAMRKENRAVTNKKTGGVEIRPPIFRDSVVENIEDVISQLETFAPLLPIDMTATLEKAKALTANGPETLRNDTWLRGETAKKADALLQELDVALGAAPAPVPVAQPAISTPVGLSELTAKLDEEFGVAKEVTEAIKASDALLAQLRDLEA